MPSSSTFDPNYLSYWSDYVYRNRNWVNTPGYRTLPRDSRPVNSYTDDRQAMRQTLYAGGFDKNLTTGVTVTTVAPGYTYSGIDIQTKFNNFFGYSDFVNTVTPVQNSGIIELLAKISDQKANLAVAYAEAAKTQTMILDTAKRLSRAIVALRRGQFDEVARELDISRMPRKLFAGKGAGTIEFHKNWLAFKYGWTPLLMDVKGTAELFAQHVVGRPLRFTVSRKKSQEFYSYRRTTYAAYGGGTSFYEERLTGTYSWHGKIWLEITNPNMAALQQMGLTNPLLIAWELVPYSFVFDWFISVGDWLKGLSALHGVSIRRSMRSNVNDLLYTYYQPQTDRVGGGHQYTNSAKYCQDKQRSYGRGTLVIDPLSLYPPINDNLGYTKLVTALALLKAAHR